ncbi:MAG TPA: DUF2277 domain-containing protein [Roseiflexaceae bacterium]|jgi:hypothetical protein
MCRSIKQLRRPGQIPSDEEIRAAALQYVRKISGYRAPSLANREAFEAAVAEIASATQRLCDHLASRERGNPSAGKSAAQAATSATNRRRQDTT